MVICQPFVRCKSSNTLFFKEGEKAMPIPFIAAGIIAASAITGVGSGVKAVKNNKEAKTVNSDASRIVKTAERTLNNRRENTNRAIEHLGETKISILSTSINDFIRYFQLLKNVEFVDSTIGIEELKGYGVRSDFLHNLETASFDAVKLASGGLASLGSGVAVAYGAYAGTMALGTASTGAAISGLYGAAASNATLAWLGGGALSAGGYGVAGGTMVLGGLVVGPALAVGGLIMSAQSKKKLNAAYENLSEARVVAEQLDGVSSALSGIKARTLQLTELLVRTNELFEEKVSAMPGILQAKGTNWNDLDRSEKGIIHKAFLLAQLLKGVIDTPLLDEDGALTKKSADMLESGQQMLEKIIEA
jgi:hypothetical protein